MTDAYGQQPAFAPVQQLQDSSTLESQALSASFHQQNLVQVPGSDAMNVVSVHGRGVWQWWARSVPACSVLRRPGTPRRAGSLLVATGLHPLGG